MRALFIPAFGTRGPAPGERPATGRNRALMDLPQMPAASSSASVANIALEIDVQTSLALSRATTRAVCAISPDAQKAMLTALEREAKLQHAQGGPVGELVAALIAGHVQDLG